MPVWQALYDELKDKNFMVVAVAEESRGADHARPWIEQAQEAAVFVLATRSTPIIAWKIFTIS